MLQTVGYQTYFLYLNFILQQMNGGGRTYVEEKEKKVVNDS